jgi:hypothetical protein
MSEIGHCQVMGPFNSGTVLMNCYVHQLFRDFKPACFEYWKHSLPPHFRHNTTEEIRAVDPSRDFNGIFFVCMVRSPYFWLPASSRRPYNFRFHVPSLDISERLRSPVYLKGELFANLVQVWNSYYRSYARHLEPLGRVIYVRLEDLVRNPHDTVRLLETRLERRPQSDTQTTIDNVSPVPCKSDNSFGEDWEEKNSLDFATRRLRQDDLSFINQQLDPQLMKKFGYSYAWVTPLTVPLPCLSRDKPV